MSLNFGSIVKSTSGRDKGYVFAVIDKRDGKLLLSDGRKRRLEKPKLKQIKHVEDLNLTLSEEIKKELLSGEITNKKLYRDIKESLKNKFESFD
ncbi:MAG: hypothetical protein E7582_02215 [Ruminococcaceae bacterium]|nr:hypothetical protein [Oscillospiraceae bacterium]